MSEEPLTSFNKILVWEDNFIYQFPKGQRIFFSRDLTLKRATELSHLSVLDLLPF